MTISVPIETEIVSTNVTDSTPDYNSTYYVTDGYLVQYNGAIYSVGIDGDRQIYSSDSSYYYGSRGVRVDDITYDPNITPSQYYKSLKDQSVAPIGINTTVTADFPDYADEIYYHKFTDTFSYGIQYKIGNFGSGEIRLTVVDNGSGAISCTTGVYENGVFLQDSDVTSSGIVRSVGSLQNYGTFVGADANVNPSDIYIDGNTAYIIVKTPSYKNLTNQIYFEEYEPTLTYYSPLNQNKPFDNKNYTKATASTSMTYVVKGNAKFDTVALGKLKCDRADVRFNGGITSNYTIDGSIDDDGNLDASSVTLISYSYHIETSGSTVEITLYGDDIEVGTILLGQSVDAGFTNLTLTNSYKDFSVLEEDEWGNLDYVERAKVSTYDGTVDIPITNYDRVDRLMRHIGANMVILNGSNLSTFYVNSTNVFASTQQIGRIRSFKQSTKVTSGDIDLIATYSFTIEEIV